MKRFLAEARAVGKLLHSHTVALYEIGQEDETMFLAMEFVPGGSVADLLAKEGKLEWKRATRFLHEVCQGLAAAHAVGVIHRDIKPENLLRTNDDHVKITDFGLAKALDAAAQPALNLTRPGNVLGTPLYMSPEQFSGVGVDHRADLYSAGATYYHLLTGERPYATATNLMQIMFAHSTGPILNPVDVVPDLPAECAAVVARSMAKHRKTVTRAPPRWPRRWPRCWRKNPFMQKWNSGSSNPHACKRGVCKECSPNSALRRFGNSPKLPTRSRLRPTGCPPPSCRLSIWPTARAKILPRRSRRFLAAARFSPS